MAMHEPETLQLFIVQWRHHADFRVGHPERDAWTGIGSPHTIRVDADAVLSSYKMRGGIELRLITVTLPFEVVS